MYTVQLCSLLSAPLALHTRHRSQPQVRGLQRSGQHCTAYPQPHTDTEMDTDHTTTASPVLYRAHRQTGPPTNHKPEISNASHRLRFVAELCTSLTEPDPCLANKHKIPITSHGFWIRDSSTWPSAATMCAAAVNQHRHTRDRRTPSL